MAPSRATRRSPMSVWVSAWSAASARFSGDVVDSLAGTGADASAGDSSVMDAIAGDNVDTAVAGEPAAATAGTTAADAVPPADSAVGALGAPPPDDTFQGRPHRRT